MTATVADARPVVLGRELTQRAWLVLLALYMLTLAVFGLLYEPQRTELRDYYSGLAGEESCDPCNLHLVGMMVDGGHIEPTETGTRLTVWWAPE